MSITACSDPIPVRIRPMTDSGSALRLVGNHDPVGVFADKGTHVCATHGRLPLASFYPSDLQHRRRRCKTCAQAATVRWWREHPGQRAWRAFVQRAKRKFGEEPLRGVRWQTHGRPLLQQFVEDVQRWTSGARQLRLEWETGATSFDLKRVRVTATSKEDILPRGDAAPGEVGPA